MVTFMRLRRGWNTRKASAISASAVSATFRSMTSVPSRASAATVSSIERYRRRWVGVGCRVDELLEGRQPIRPPGLA